MNIKLNENGAIHGKVRKTYSDYLAYSFRNRFGSIAEEDYLDKMENDFVGMELINYEISEKNSVGKPIKEEYEFDLENQLEVVGDKMYFSPLFHRTVSENPFRLEERKYPVDFAFPWRENYLITIDIPEGYEVTFLPKSVNMSLQDNIGSFIYRIGKQGNNKLQLMVDLKINQAIIPAQSYAAIKELYKNMVEKQSEKVVLSKISENGPKERTEGGR